MSLATNPLPLAFVGRDIDHKIIGNYMKKKHPVLSRCAGKPDNLSIYCDLIVFEDLINTIAGQTGAAAMKAYFATYHALPSPINDIPDTYLGTTTLIFTPVDGTGTDMPLYYIIHPSKGVVEISFRIANKMAYCFRVNRATHLRDVAVTARPGFIESRSVWIELPKLNDPDRGWLQEMKAQNADGVTLHFAAHGVDDKDFLPDPTGVNPPIGLQLTLIMLPTKKTTVDDEDYYYFFDLEDTPDFPARLIISRDPTTGQVGGGNTFNPCPPAKTGCTSSIGDAP